MRKIKFSILFMICEYLFPKSLSLVNQLGEIKILLPRESFEVE